MVKNGSPLRGEPEGGRVEKNRQRDISRRRIKCHVVALDCNGMYQSQNDLAPPLYRVGGQRQRRKAAICTVRKVCSLSGEQTYRLVFPISARTQGFKVSTLRNAYLRSKTLAHESITLQEGLAVISKTLTQKR